MIDISALKFDQNGLVPVVVQDSSTGEVLMLAYMNKEALELTIQTGYMHYFSRSRNKIWKKGETSGNVQKLKSLFLDCDGDTLLAIVEQTGVACHTGNKTCFFTALEGDKKKITTDIIFELMKTINDRKQNKVEGSYTCYLFEKGLDKILKKIGEEATEVVIGAKNGQKEEIIYEISDLMYHLSVLLAYFDLDWTDIFKSLEGRRK
ncbi:phosphoribosyl-ATP diphosphatase [Caldicellulosiruptor acetigenus I77R1B]|jgi:phosphoribosyl-ATP pyrophosphohydrolase/phosphoribosyl-AMP cyclohydrolase|uniref:Histidine biosynthesis bifunctional protein HisIE n=2 Tax=Caldicellulosiruptor acetigenus TaxID=301953 RepID=G2PUA2_9FIRM|nr:bifunctional phosphoribosyl-AMP cyclohydrolase/phosphoribosyl-ATP diphosphatase HisIE [Caldicellulosiruptor acetigenus]ADQ40959.1 phosphoribosyl-ATP diphosphatase [Caldicellulosiruptor acetigenus I77R1B]AEM73494.1 Histidine biosynthesis bifunctional protein hisIE [Caldicellulosiruptor acetigenus 6A]WAM37419.1 bifunctional phosphoribosyl-AMP cyclohydrolase/phosphoribosyl-ATP diphosphatase HisIE [Caldicellulosiruptor acetigenus]